jgi:hypothetical protein
MPTDLEYLATIRTAILAALATNGAKPDYNIDGQTVAWGDLYGRLAQVNAAIAAAGGPFEETEEAFT